MHITITGVVRSIDEDYRKAVLLIIEQRHGLKTNTVAVRCYPESLRRRAQDFKPGDVVEAYGLISSRQGGAERRWYTAFEAEGLRAINSGGG